MLGLSRRLLSLHEEADWTAQASTEKEVLQQRFRIWLVREHRFVRRGERCQVRKLHCVLVHKLEVRKLFFSAERRAGLVPCSQVPIASSRAASEHLLLLRFALYIVLYVESTRPPRHTLNSVSLHVEHSVLY